MGFFYLVAGIIEDSLLLFWIFAIVSVVVLFFKKKKLFYLLAGVSLAWLFLISVSPLPQYLISELEDDFPIIDHTAFNRSDSISILVLGGGHSIAPSIPATAQLTNIALARLAEAVRISKFLPCSIIITSGYSASGRITQAEVLQAAALELGFPQDRINVSKRP